MLAAYADGTKMSPMVLLPQKRPLPKTVIPSGIVVHMCGNGKSWCDEDVMEKGGDGDDNGMTGR